MLNRTIAPAVHDAVNFNFQLPDCRRSVFRNNLSLYWLCAGTQDVVQLEWVFKAGLWEENKPGVAYATAGMIRNGTSSKTEAQINEALEFYGASLHSSANNDYSTLSLHCLSRHLGKLLPIVQEIIFDARFPENELDIYRRNAIQHLSVNLKKVDFVANREADAQVFGYDHPYGRFSKKENLEELQVADLKEFHSQYYTSANCTLFMAGMVDTGTVTLVEQYFGREQWGMPLGAGIVAKQHLITPGKKRKLQLDIQEESVQGAVRLLRAFPDRHHPDFVPMVLLNTLLGGYFGSRLMANIREDKGYTYGIYSQIYAYERASTLTIATEAGKEVCTAVIEESRKEMQRLCREAVSDEELSLVKNYLFGSLLGDLDGPFSLIRRWKGLILNGFDREHFYDNLRIYRSATPGELQQLAQKYFDPGDYYELVVV
ncbi:MAG TPA: pitrilysin family protein [Edaphocola sp.]|nr:pitrilysin family protein [Edaphocola sp.]